MDVRVIEEGIVSEQAIIFIVGAHAGSVLLQQMWLKEPVAGVW